MFQSIISTLENDYHHSQATTSTLKIKSEFAGIFGLAVEP